MLLGWGSATLLWRFAGAQAEYRPPISRHGHCHDGISIRLRDRPILILVFSLGAWDYLPSAGWAVRRISA